MSERVGIIYLDQAHLSRMAKARLGVNKQLEPDELALLGELERLVQAGTVVCPYSFWHVTETAVYDHDPVRDEICRLVGLLSRGHCFKWAYDLVLDEMTNAIEQSVVRAAPTKIAPIGGGLDCFPREVIADYSREYIAGIPPERRFAESIKLGRGSENIVLATKRNNRVLHAVEQKTAPARDEHRLSLVEARAVEAHAVVNGLLVTDWITRTAGEQRLPREMVAQLILRDDLAMVPTLAMMVEIRARRDVTFGRQPKESDPSDVRHMLALPYCDWFLTDRQAAALSRDAGRVVQTVVLSEPAELLAQLKAKYPD